MKTRGSEGHNPATICVALIAWSAVTALSADTHCLQGEWPADIVVLPVREPQQGWSIPVPVRPAGRRKYGAPPAAGDVIGHR